MRDFRLFIIQSNDLKMKPEDFNYFKLLHGTRTLKHLFILTSILFTVQNSCAKENIKKKLYQKFDILKLGIIKGLLNYCRYRVIATVAYSVVCNFPSNFLTCCLFRAFKSLNHLLLTVFNISDHSVRLVQKFTLRE